MSYLLANQRIPIGTHESFEGVHWSPEGVHWSPGLEVNTYRRVPRLTATSREDSSG